jgi:hypothetical protein
LSVAEIRRLARISGTPPLRTADAQSRDFIGGSIVLASIDYVLDLDALYEQARIGRPGASEASVR